MIQNLTCAYFSSGVGEKPPTIRQVLREFFQVHPVSEPSIQVQKTPSLASIFLLASKKNTGSLFIFLECPGEHTAIFCIFFPWLESINKNIHGSRESMVDSDFLDVCALPFSKKPSTC